MIELPLIWFILLLACAAPALFYIGLLAVIAVMFCVTILAAGAAWCWQQIASRS